MGSTFFEVRKSGNPGGGLHREQHESGHGLHLESKSGSGRASTTKQIEGVDGGGHDNMHVCVLACMHISMYACMHTCIYAGMLMDTCTGTYADTGTDTEGGVEATKKIY